MREIFILGMAVVLLKSKTLDRIFVVSFTDLEAELYTKNIKNT